MTCRSPNAAALRALVAISVIALGACSDPWRGVERVDAEPVQTNFETYPSWHHGDFLLEAVAEYDIEAIVLSTHRYRLARFSRLSPLDVALAWGPMSDPSVLREIEVAQRHRWYIYSWRDEPPLGIETMNANSANVHTIAADRIVARRLARLRPGDRVRLVGRLVNASDERGEMRTSQSRTDRAGGACEVMYVETVELR